MKFIVTQRNVRYVKNQKKEEILIKNSKDEGSLDIEICNSCKNYKTREKYI